MSREALQESLSAVMDNEADELELRRVLGASNDAEMRATWSRYQVARAVMHKDLLVPQLDIAAAVSAALADDATPAAEQKVVRGPWRSLGRVAVAATVTVAVLAGVRFYNEDDVAGAQLAQQDQPAIALPQAQGPAILAGFSTSDSQPSIETVSAETEQELPEYLRQQAQQTANGAAVSDQER
ncbi:anti-sigma factor [Pseudomonas seleniipraecipitans]|jgi:sigma-E factor negative regulatory protein RseA|uniref:Anti sigma-E protein, RseA n=1 Tax=Phytopseudomonas seleniipraecipitans TaxID=640205 RepID=A0A1G7NSY1_9GAMM|nr:RseA family anti-sigma factor [Pseudomonas seleniipraecipitans]UUD65106.1 anti-sigma factor [Pseudomonas seleniipraecipitans]SDF77027.1 anti sigma-E protein, RseA [Pseudomonas seleniipraecipitans]